MLIRQFIIVYEYSFTRGSTVSQPVINESMISYAFEVFDAKYIFHYPECIETSGPISL
jgi:type IV secretory pathway VirB6-like protein